MYRSQQQQQPRAVRLAALAGLALSLTAMAGARAAPVVFSGNGHAYELILDGQSSWTEARAAAQASGRDLATITSSAEQQFVENLLGSANAPTGSYWFGLRQTADNPGPNDAFAPITGTSSFTNFAPFEPNEGGNQDERVGGIYWTRDGGDPVLISRRGKWNDLPEAGYPNAASGTPMQADLLRAGYIVEADDAGGGGNPTPIPLPAAFYASAPVALVAAWAARRMKRRGDG